jgi:hypothetical protein
VHLGFGHTRIKKKGIFQAKHDQVKAEKSTWNVTASTHLGVPTSPPASEALVLRFRAVALGFRVWLGKRSPPGELPLSWAVFLPWPFITSASLSLPKTGPRSVDQRHDQDGRLASNTLMAADGADVRCPASAAYFLYTFTSCCNKIDRRVSTIEDKLQQDCRTEGYRYIHVLEAPWQSTSSVQRAQFHHPSVLGLLVQWHQISELALQKTKKSLRLQGTQS